jgi:hypothetical protein
MQRKTEKKRLAEEAGALATGLRTEMVTLRVSPKEREKLSRLALTAGLDVTELMRVSINRTAEQLGVAHVFCA